MISTTLGGNRDASFARTFSGKMPTLHEDAFTDQDAFGSVSSEQDLKASICLDISDDSQPNIRIAYQLFKKIKSLHMSFMSSWEGTNAFPSVSHKMSEII